MPIDGLTNANSRPLAMRTAVRRRQPAGIFEKALGQSTGEVLGKLYERMPPQRQREFWTLQEPRDEKVAYLMLHAGMDLNGGRA